MATATIGRYTILGEIGRGGMATVYRAHDPRLGRDVAVKVLPRELLHDPAFRARFRREVEAVAALEHPAIVPVYESGEHEGQPFMVMRLMAGGTLAERLAAGPVPLHQAARLIAQLAPALDAAHAAGLIHRDVKADNILFDGDGSPYLADFGIVSLAEAATRLTRSGVVGTPDYMAPELTRPAGLTPLVDIYALGVLLFQMLTGRLPYTADTPLGTLVAHVTEPIPDLPALRPDLPPAAQAVLARAMAKDPRARYQSAGELAADLTALAAGEAPQTVRVAGGELRRAARPAPEPRRRWPGLLFALSAAALLGAILIRVLPLSGGAPGPAAGLRYAAPTPTATASPVPYPTDVPYPAPNELRRGSLVFTPGAVGMLSREIALAAYSAPLDRLILVARSPDYLILLDPPQWRATFLELPVAGTALAVSPDGRLGAVSYGRHIRLIDLAQAELLQEVPVEGEVGSLALGEGGRAYYLLAPEGEPLREIELQADAPASREHPGGPRSPATLALLHGALYSASRGGATSALTVYRPGLESPGVSAVSELGEDACGAAWPSPRGDYIVTACARVLSQQPEGARLRPIFKLGTLPILRDVAFGPGGGPILALAAPRPAGGRPREGWPPLDHVYVYDAMSLSPITIVGLPMAVTGADGAGGRSQIEARSIFSRRDGSAYYVLVYAPDLDDYGLLVLRADSPASLDPPPSLADPRAPTPTYQP